MARLNEAPIPTESVEVLKRRFVRQNRELAKNNSAQCMRIRALECEVSRLLADNLNLREEVLHLQNELATTQSHADPSGLASVKHQLEAKLRDFGALIAELDNVQRVSSLVENKREADPSSWRPEIPIAALSGQCQRMSIIGEETVFQGESMHDNDDARHLRLSDQSNESPDIGPPPIARFDDQEPIRFDPNPQSNDNQAEETNDDDDIPAVLSVNLESRRKRRDTYSKHDMRSVSSTALDTGDSTQTAKPSSKRKLSIRDAEELDLAPVNDDFVFSRRTSITGDNRKGQSNNETPSLVLDTEKETAVDQAPNLAPRTERQVLGNKSVNMSPRKRDANRGGKDGLSKPDQPQKETTKTSGRARKPRTSSIKPLQLSEPVLSTVEIALPETEQAMTVPPKTPAADLFSPTPSQPSTTRPDGRDTPPPSAFTTATTALSEMQGGGRPSRRARAAVNYAEPNLISKMRRPDKNMADAVTLNGRRSTSYVPGSETKQQGRTVVIKQEGSGSSVWKSLPHGNDMARPEPGSPLGGKGDSMQQDEAKRAGEHMSTSGEATTIVVGHRTGQKRGKEDTTTTATNTAENDDKMQEMDLYDFKDTSPSSASAEKQTSSRRHSSMSGAAGRDATTRRASKVQTQLFAESNKAPPSLQAETTSKKPERITARRRSMMV